MGEIIQIGRYERPGRKINDRYRVFSKYGIAPCLNCCEGGNIMPFVIENEETLYAKTKGNIKNGSAVEKPKNNG